MRILIVEDERRLAEALGAIMEEQKYSADVVFNGQDGPGLRAQRTIRCDRAGRHAAEDERF